MFEIHNHHNDCLLLVETSELEELRNSVCPDLILKWRSALDGLPQVYPQQAKIASPCDDRSNW